MITLSEVQAELDRYVKPVEYPVAVKMLQSFDPDKLRREHPKAKIPHLDLGHKLVTCQAMAMARKYGWELILTREDIPCGTGLVSLGLAPMIDSMAEGKDQVAPYNQSAAARARRMGGLHCFDFGKYQAVVVAPIHRAGFVPDAMVIYASGAQVMRLVQGAVFHEGGSLSSSSAGGQGCSQYITKVIRDNECRYVLPGNGDRVFGMVQDGQMIFAMPWGKVASVMEGLAASHQGGQRLPVPSYLRFDAQMPAEYNQLTEKLLAAAADKGTG